MSKKCTPLWREAHFEVKSVKNWRVQITFGSWDVEKVTPLWREAKHISKSKVQKTDGYGTLLEVQMSCCVAGARDSAPCQKWAKRESFLAFPKNDGRRGTYAFSVAGAVQETCSSELLGGLGADFLRWVAFWRIRSSGLLRWFCVTGAALRMTWHHFFVAGTVL